MPNSCIEGRGFLNSSGYKQVRVGGKKVLEHRLAYCNDRGLELEDIADKVVRHRCDNPPCCNPDHLELGTVSDNVQDKVGRGRVPNGEGHYKTNLSVDQADYIRAVYVKGCRRCGTRALAKEFGVSQASISRIVNGHRLVRSVA